MKRDLAFVTILSLVVVLFAACSVRNDFVLLNRSSKYARVSYTIKNCTSETNKTFIRPAKLTIADLENESRDWNYLSDEQIYYDETCTVTVELASNEALLIYYAYNYSAKSAEDQNRFPVVSLTVDGAPGRMSFDGEQVLKQFAEESGRYSLTFY